MDFTNYPVRAGSNNFDDLKSYLTSRRRDVFTSPLSGLEINPESGKLNIVGASFPMTRHAVQTLASLVKIPPRYMITTPTENAASNFNFFLPSATGNVEVLLEDMGEGNVVVGFTKENKTPIPLDLVVEELESKSHGLDLMQWRVDEAGLSARFISSKFAVEPRVGDMSYAGVDFMDFENDDGGLDVRGAIYRLACTNGTVVPEVAYGRYIRRENWKEPYAVMNAAMGYFEDTITNVASFADRLKSLTELPLELPEEKPEKFLASPLKVLAVKAKYHESVVDALQPEEDTFYGMYNAVTRLGRDASERDVKFMFERAGFRMISLLPEFTEAYNMAGSTI